MTTPTPRTGAAEIRPTSTGPDAMVTATFARQLERELAGATARAEKAEAEAKVLRNYERIVNEAFDSQPWANDLPIIQQLNGVTERMESAEARIRELEAEVTKAEFALASKDSAIQASMQLVDYHKARVRELEAQLARKDEALRPFANKADRIMTKNEHYGHSQYVTDEIRYAVRFGDLRRAAEVLATGGNAPEPKPKTCGECAHLNDTFDCRTPGLNVWTRPEASACHKFQPKATGGKESATA